MFDIDVQEVFDSNVVLVLIPYLQIFFGISGISPNTVVTPNKGQSIFGKIGSNKGISQIPLFVIFDKWCEIRDFSVEIRQKW